MTKQCIGCCINVLLVHFFNVSRVFFLFCIFFASVDAPPSPGSPYFVAVGSTWVTLGWTELSCDGGHTITELVIRYKEESDDVVSSYNYLYNLDPSLRNYTIQNLEPDTAYTFAVQAVSAEFLPSPFSDNDTVNTLSPGIYTCFIGNKAIICCCFLHLAPSPPRDVRARLVRTPVVEVTWREPVSPNGIILYYTVYATIPNGTVFLNGLSSVIYTTSAVKVRINFVCSCLETIVLSNYSVFLGILVLPM